jgi:hypothetical protein
MYNEMNNNKTDSLQRLKLINLSLDNMNIINKKYLKRIPDYESYFEDK